MNPIPETADDAVLRHQPSTIAQQDVLAPEKTIEEPPDDAQKWFAGFIPSKEYFVTPLLVFINIAVFAIMLIRGGSLIAPSPDFLVEWGGNIRRLTLDGEPWRLFTSIFLHIGIIHLMLNCCVLLMIGRQIEPKIGPLNFAILYVCTGLIASMTSIMWHINNVSAGASGAIFGMFGLLLGMLLSKTVYFKDRQSILISVSLLIIYNLFSGMKTGVDNAAHVGGLISGLAAGSLAGSYMVEGNGRRHNLGLLVGCSAIAAGICWMGLSMTTNTMKIYEEQMKTFEVREKEALAILRIDASTDKEEIVYQLVDRGVYYWQENIELLKKLKTLKLPEEVVRENDRLIKYCELRVDSYHLLAKTFEENTDKYKEQLERYNKEIESLFR